MVVHVKELTLLLTDRKHWLILTIDSGAVAKISLLILLQLQRRTTHYYTKQIFTGGKQSFIN